MDAAGLAISVVGLIAEVTAAVARAQSAPKEVQGVYDRLRTLNGCLGQFNTVLTSEDASFAIKTHLQKWEEVVNQLGLDTKELLGVVQQAHTNLSANPLRRLQAKIGFAIDRDKISTLERKLSAHIETLELLMGTLHTEQLAAVQKDLAKMSLESKFRDGFKLPFHLSNVPVIHEFINRPEDMAALEAVLLPKPSDPRRQTLVLHGMGGIGKTQLAVEFARKHRSTYSCIFFIDGASREALLRSFLVIYQRIIQEDKPRDDNAQNSIAYLAEVVKEVLGWFDSPGNDDWLLIFDNVDRAPSDHDGFEIQSYFPSRDSGSILVTTRLPSLPISGHRRRLAPMSPMQASSLLRSFVLGSTSSRSEYELLTQLAGLPLALAQAGKFIQSLGIDLDEYLELYNNSSKGEIMGASFEGTSPGSMSTTWLTSVNLLKERMGSENEADKHSRAYRLLQLFAYFDSANLDYEVLRRGLVGNDVPNWFQQTFRTKLAFYSTVQVLLDLSLLDSTATPGCYSMHRVMYEWLAHTLVRETDPEFLTIAVAAVGFAVPDVLTPGLPREQARLILHANAMLPRLLEYSCSFPMVDFSKMNQQELATSASLLHEMPDYLLHRQFDYPLRFSSNLFWMDGKKTEALNILDASITHHRQAGLSDNHPILLVLKYSRCAKVMYSQPKLAGALFQQLLQQFVSMKLPYWIIKTRNMQALFHLQNWQLAEASEIWLELLSQCLEAYSPTHDLTSMVVYNMASFQDRLPESRLKSLRKLVEKVYEATEAVALVDLKSREMIREIATFYLRCGDSARAEQILQRILQMEIMRNGEGSLAAAMARADLETTLRGLQRGV
ncbi:hypothetical protein NKR23_g9430 [Pleurostoma richardsiae]|uniref:NB-ARC domain-containing protein n=1 Tax=Pleurostoma richardsiae TaxID=41990 RepID=A0AA38R610_9PEZI|nr:hypothetical protein NKR23_g9430 [Pleurostoma richardsiae]